MVRFGRVRLRSWLAERPWALQLGLSISVLALLAAIIVWIPTPYQILLPGPVRDTNTLVEPAPAPSQGAFYLTSIYSDPANIAEWLYARLSPEAGLIPREQARPQNLDNQQYRRLLATMMGESKVAAKVVALRAAGYEVTATGSGAQVREVINGAPADGVLQIGDIVVALDGRPITSATELITSVQERRPGDHLTLEARRDETSQSFTITLAESRQEPGRPWVGIVIHTYQFQYAFPRELDIRTKDLGGPSAGLMFALAIYNAVTPGDLTGGHLVAGTGALSIEGRVGGVGGVKYKVRAAEGAGAGYFIAPETNAAEAREAARMIEVVAVKTFADALAFVQGLPPV